MARNSNYVFTPARQAAQRKAALASAKARRGRKIKNNHRIYGQAKNRPTGLKGLRATFTPYARANKRSQTIGYNAGTIIPGTKKRIAFGAYARLENTTRKTATDRAINKAVYKYAKPGTTRGSIVKYAKGNVRATAPAIRANVGGAEARLGTSRGAGPTVIIRRGTHKAPINKTKAGVKKYAKDTQKKKSKSRRQRRSSGSSK